MKKIKKLTPLQEASLVETYQAALIHGRNCEPLDRAAATKAIGDMYAAIGEDRPVVLFFSSPIMCILAHGVLTRCNLGQSIAALAENGAAFKSTKPQLESQLGSQLESQLWSQLESQLESQLRSQLESQLGSQLESQLRSQLGSQLGSQLESQLWSQLRSQLGSQLWSQLESQLWSQLRSQLGNYFGGAHWMAWEVFYDFCNRIGVEYTTKERATLDLWLAQSIACHWWWPYNGIVLASERHTELHLDDRGRLHNLHGPAVKYSDGWGVYASHGVRLPADIIEQPGAITTKRVDEERNAEVRRVMIELYGQARYLFDAGAAEVARDDYGTLYRKEIPGDEPLVMVKVVNSTAEPDGSFKDYFLRVPPSTKTPREAVAWSFGVSAEEYEPAIQT